MSQGGYIGNVPVPQSTQVRTQYTALAGQTTFNVRDTYTPPFVDVYRNGAKLSNGTDVDITSGTDVVLAVGATLNDTIDIVSYDAFSIANTYTVAEIDAITMAATPAEVRTGLDNSKKVTSLNLNQTQLGWGQSYQNMLGLRLLGSTYINTSGRPIFVTVGVSDFRTPNYYSVGLFAVVDGITVADSNLSSTATAEKMVAICSFIVPDGSSYVVDVLEPGFDSIEYWTELS